ncbi:MAG: hypothetical protein JO223_10120 [Hyphomicrobiales bacterium]|nr:hypothetical protein [Hyphomicrobiales bacterium]
MGKRVRVVNRKDHTPPRIREPQQSRHRYRGHFTAARDLNSGADHLLQLRRLRQWWSNV